jgi:hypothetical protein
MFEIITDFNPCDIPAVQAERTDGARKTPFPSAARFLHRGDQRDRLDPMSDRAPSSGSLSFRLA